jgi:chromosome partitioning protein
MTIIAVTSNKGGVAKTTSAVSIATGLSVGFTTLLADFDPQGHASIALGVDPAPGVYRFFVDEDNGPGAFQPARSLALMPGNSMTRRAETVLRMEKTVDQITDRFRPLTQAYPFIVIDTPPGGLLQEVAIRLADVLVIPVRCETLGLDGVVSTVLMAEKIGQARRIIILPTIYDKRLKEHLYNLDILQQKYGDRVAPPVPARVAVAEAQAEGRTVWDGNGGLTEVQQAYVNVLELIHEVD